MPKSIPYNVLDKIPKQTVSLPSSVLLKELRDIWPSTSGQWDTYSDATTNKQNTSQDLTRLIVEFPPGGIINWCNAEDCEAGKTRNVYVCQVIQLNWIEAFWTDKASLVESKTSSASEYKSRCLFFNLLYYYSSWPGWESSPAFYQVIIIYNVGWVKYCIKKKKKGLELALPF